MYTNLSGYCCCGCLVTKLCLSLCDPVDYSLQGSFVHGILQARILEWVTVSFSRGSSRPRYRTQVCSLASRFFTPEPRGKPPVEVLYLYSSVQFLSLVRLCDLMDCSTPGFPVLHCLPAFAHTHIHWDNDTTQPSHCVLPLIWYEVSSSHQVARLLDLQLQHQSFQWIFRVDFLEDWLVWSRCPFTCLVL